MTPRLPVASRDDLIAELAQKNVVNPEGRLNRLASLDEWEADLRLQLAEMAAGSNVRGAA